MAKKRRKVRVRAALDTTGIDEAIRAMGRAAAGRGRITDKQKADSLRARLADTEEREREYLGDKIKLERTVTEIRERNNYLERVIRSKDKIADEVAVLAEVLARLSVRLRETTAPADDKR